MNKENEKLASGEYLVRRFLKENVRRDPCGTILPRALYLRFREWCTEKDIYPVGRNSFYYEMETRYYRMIRRKRFGTKLYWVGICLTQK